VLQYILVVGGSELRCNQGEATIVSDGVNILKGSTSAKYGAGEVVMISCGTPARSVASRPQCQYSPQSHPNGAGRARTPPGRGGSTSESLQWGWRDWGVQSIKKCNVSSVE